MTTQIGLPEAELHREVGKLFGAKRMSARMTDAINASIDAAIRRGFIRRADGYVTLADP